MDRLCQSPLAQQSAVSEANSPHSSQNGEFSAPGTAGENSSVAAGELSPGHMTSDIGSLHSANPAGLCTGRGSLQYQGTEYNIIDESIPE